VLPRRGSDADVVNGLLRDHEADLVVLAGYLRLVPIEVVRAHRGRIVNVHPALLPAFGGPGMYGGRVHRAVLESGTRVTGATVHFVDEEYDRGATIAQWPVPVLAGDSAETLAARVLRVEHLLLPRAVDAVARGEVRLDDDGLIVRASNTTPTPNLAFTLRPQDDEELAQGIATMLAGD
jgi:Folate-dependent phosphoribosylglycinamide formyltransferase PurN